MIFSAIIQFVNLVIKMLGKIINLLFIFLPSSPFKILDSTPIVEFVESMNYFIPINEIILICEAWLLAIGTFYLVQIILRWVKAVN